MIHSMAIVRTAEKAKITSTPSDLSAAIFARYGTSEGFKGCPWPWRAKKAIFTPLCWQIWILLEGGPQGYS
jgi:hypothetical protein